MRVAISATNPPHRAPVPMARRRAQLDGAFALVLRLVAFVFYLGAVLAAGFGFDNPESRGNTAVRYSLAHGVTGGRDVLTHQRRAR